MHGGVATQELTREVRCCARCLGDHGGLRFVPFRRPVQIEGQHPFTHWAQCPTSGEPILQRVEDSSLEAHRRALWGAMRARLPSLRRLLHEICDSDCYEIESTWLDRLAGELARAVAEVPAPHDHEIHAWENEGGAAP